MFKCANADCGAVSEELEPLSTGDWIESGAIVPHGECPKCGGYCFPYEGRREYELYIGFSDHTWYTRLIEADSYEEAEDILRKRLEDDPPAVGVSFIGLYHEGDVIEANDDEEEEDWNGECDYELSENQKLFVREAEEQGLEINWDYSGRGMCGKCCPAVMVDGLGDFRTTAVYESDSMGLGFVIYARY